MITAPSMNPGRLDRRIVLRSPVETRDAAGGVVTDWLEVSTVWAGWQPQSGREIQQAGQKLALAVGTFRIRWYGALSATWQPVMGATAFEITAPPVEVGRREYMDLVVRALSAEAPAAVSAQLLHDYSPRLLHDSSLRLLHAA